MKKLILITIFISLITSCGSDNTGKNRGTFGPVDGSDQTYVPYVYPTGTTGVSTTGYQTYVNGTYQYDQTANRSRLLIPVK